MILIAWFVVLCPLKLKSSFVNYHQAVVQLINGSWWRANHACLFLLMRKNADHHQTLNAAWIRLIWHWEVRVLHAHIHKKSSKRHNINQAALALERVQSSHRFILPPPTLPSTFTLITNVLSFFSAKKPTTVVTQVTCYLDRSIISNEWWHRDIQRKASGDAAPLVSWEITFLLIKLTSFDFGPSQGSLHQIQS